MSRNFITFIALGSLFNACSSIYRDPFDVNQKISWADSHYENKNPLPQIELPQDRSIQRGPASTPKKAKEAPNPVNGLNPKALYLTSLWEQYRDLGRYSNAHSEKIQHCPKYHNLFLKYKKKYNDFEGPKSPLTASRYEKMWDLPGHHYPELKLRPDDRPLENRLDKGMTAQAIVTQAQKAIDQYRLNMRKELTEICESGSSPNLNAYLNLLNHKKDNKKLTAKDLIKIGPMANEYLLLSLEKGHKMRAPASATSKRHSANAILNEVDGHWFKAYLMH